MSISGSLMSRFGTFQYRIRVAPSTVTRMQQSERDDRIQLGTLKRALAVTGRSPHVKIVNNRREERVTIELHRALANKLRNNPTAALDVVPKNIGRLRTRLPSPIGQKWVDRWVELVNSPIDVLMAGMLADTPEGWELRQNSPFTGALTQDERLAAIERQTKRGREELEGAIRHAPRVTPQRELLVIGSQSVRGVLVPLRIRDRRIVIDSWADGPVWAVLRRSR